MLPLFRAKTTGEKCCLYLGRRKAAPTQSVDNLQPFLGIHLLDARNPERGHPLQLRKKKDFSTHHGLSWYLVHLDVAPS